MGKERRDAGSGLAKPLFECPPADTARIGSPDSTRAVRCADTIWRVIRLYSRPMRFAPQRMLLMLRYLQLLHLYSVP